MALNLRKDSNLKRELHKRFSRETRQLKHEFHQAAAAGAESPPIELYAFREDYSLMLAFAVAMLSLILLTLPIILWTKKGCPLYKANRGARRVASNNDVSYTNVSESEGYLALEHELGEDVESTVRFVHDDEEYEIVEMANRGTQAEGAQERELELTSPKHSVKILSYRDGFTNVSEGSMIEGHPNDDKATNTNNPGSNKATMPDYNSNNVKRNSPVERFYYTRPVDHASSSDHRKSVQGSGVQTSVNDIIRECPMGVQKISKCPKKICEQSVPPTGPRLWSECKLITGISTRFQPNYEQKAAIRNDKPSRGKINMCRDDYVGLVYSSRSAHLTWSDVVDHTKRSECNSNVEQYCSPQPQCQRYGYAGQDSGNYGRCQARSAPSTTSERKGWWSFW